MKKIFSVCMLMLFVTMAFAAKVDKVVNISVKDDNGKQRHAPIGFTYPMA